MDKLLRLVWMIQTILLGVHLSRMICLRLKWCVYSKRTTIKQTYQELICQFMLMERFTGMKFESILI